ncbi:MAG: RluA family pseudouridine synthase [Dongiaceae bacterium]
MITQNNSGRHEITAGEAEAGTRLDRLIAAGAIDLSRSRAKALIEAGHVICGGATISDPSYRVKPGQVFAVTVPPAAPTELKGQSIALDIVHEDADLIIINKPAGMVVHPSPGHADATLVNALIAHCGASLSGIGGELRPGIVHRLDKDTSGLMVVAKNDATHRALSEALAARQVARAYHAVLWGVPSPAQGEIEGAIGRHPTNRKKMALVARGGKAALTRYRVIRRLGGAASLVECRLATGRTHQIRVHMAAIGHPVIGDPTYGRVGANRLAQLGPDAADSIKSLGRQALHAVSLRFSHPRTGAVVQCEIDLPNDINKLIRSLESID